MSIISDALKKASDRKTDVARLRREELSSIFVDDKKRILTKKTRWSFLSGIGTLFIVGLAVILFFSHGEFISQTIIAALHMPAFGLGQIFNRQAPFAGETEIMPRFALNGIVEGAGESLAMINNSIVKKGDFFLGAQIIDIEQDKVTLLYNRKEITLRIK